MKLTMERKICTYTEKTHRLQLVMVSNEDESDAFFEVRYNRVLLKRDKNISYMRLVFSYYAHEICVVRQSPLSNMT